MKDPPEPGVLFPSLRTPKDAVEDSDDESIFMQVASSMSQYNK